MGDPENTIEIPSSFPTPGADTEERLDESFPNQPIIQSTPNSTPTTMDSNSVENFNLKKPEDTENLLLTPNVEGKYQAVADMKNSLGEKDGNLSRRLDGVTEETRKLDAIRKDYQRMENEPKTFNATPLSGLPMAGVRQNLDEAIAENAKKMEYSREELKYLQENLSSIKNQLDSILSQISSVREIRENNIIETPENNTPLE